MEQQGIRRQPPAREPKPFPRYDDAAHIDSAAVAAIPPWAQDKVPRGDPAATVYTEMYCQDAQQ
ncbi:MAG: hypothetical protein Q4D31_03390 [Eubacteriales bacterium]|nr:hypothetical protein [Eubacteriales bacterium]